MKVGKISPHLVHHAILYYRLTCKQNGYDILLEYDFKCVWLGLPSLASSSTGQGLPHTPL